MISFLASESHYADHLWPVWKAIQRRDQIGHFVCPGGHPGGEDSQAMEVWGAFWAPRVLSDLDKSHWWVVASIQDASGLRNLGIKKVVMMEHGVGQTYAGVDTAGYIGAARDGFARAYWMPNPRARDLQQSKSRSPVYQIHNYRLDELRKIRAQGLVDAELSMDKRPVVAISFHQTLLGCPEQKGTYLEWQANGALAKLLSQKDLRIIGHAHPRSREVMGKFWKNLGVKFVPDFNDVIRQATVYVQDNSSSLYEAAACGIPVVVLNGQSYRPAAKHGLRFWAMADVGVQVWNKGPDVANRFLEAIIKTVAENPAKDRARAITRELFPQDGMDVDTLIRLLEDPMSNQNTERTQGIIYARALRNIDNKQIGTVHAGQIFQPGYHHTQKDGRAVADKLYAKPEAICLMLVSGKAAERVDDVDRLMQELPGLQEADEVVTPAPETEAPVVISEPTEESGDGTTGIGTGVQGLLDGGLGGAPGSPEPEHQPEEKEAGARRSRRQRRS